LFQIQQHALENDLGIRYTFGQLPYAKMLDTWMNCANFRASFSQILADAPFEGFRWETPAVTTETLDRPFEFVLLDASSFATRKTDTKSFAEHFEQDDSENGVVAFENLGRNALLVVPSPRTEDDVYGHLASFVRGAPESQIDALWQVVGEVMLKRVGEKPVWLSTAGGGVAWLHVRLDSTPKYYGYSPYRRS